MNFICQSRKFSEMKSIFKILLIALVVVVGLESVSASHTRDSLERDSSAKTKALEVKKVKPILLLSPFGASLDNCTKAVKKRR